MHYFYINNSKSNEKLKEYGFVISRLQNEYLQRLKQEQGYSEADLVRRIVDLVFDNQLEKEIENLIVDDNVSDIRKNIKFTKSQLAHLEQIANDLKISKSEVIRRVIAIHSFWYNYLSVN